MLSCHCVRLLRTLDTTFLLTNRKLFHTSLTNRKLFHTSPYHRKIFHNSPSHKKLFHTNPTYRKAFHSTEAVVDLSSTCEAEAGLSKRISEAEMESVEDLNSIDVLEEKPVEAGERPEYPWKRAKKVAAMLSFSGKNYYGMQRNPGDLINTIEDELMSALSKAGAIDPDWEKVPQKAFFTRASRTDKGVSAARMTVSLKMLAEQEMVEKVNSCLPADIRLQALVRVTKNFNCQSAADGRTYLYLLPTFAFSPCEEVVTEAWRCKPDTIDNINKVFKHYIGSHYYHNFTSSKLPMEPSSRRFISEFSAGQPFERLGLEWSVVTVRGQSFMLHQIRKMIGLGIAIGRGHTGIQSLEASWGQERIDIPRAPGLGLLLDAIHYDRYNKRYGDTHALLDWAGQDEAVEKFKEDFIFSDIMRTEAEEKSMLSWMGEVLPMHTFTPRHFENEDKERQPLKSAKIGVARDTAGKRVVAEGEEDAVVKDAVVEKETTAPAES